MTEFITNLTTEQKNMRQYKYTIYLYSDKTTPSQYSCYIIDKFSHKTILSEQIEGADISIRVYIIGLINAIEFILNNIDDEFHKFCLIHIKTDNIFFLSLINEWINEWKITDFQLQPPTRASELRILYSLLKKIHFKTSVVSKISTEYLKTVTLIV